MTALLLGLLLAHPVTRITSIAPAPLQSAIGNQQSAIATGLPATGSEPSWSHDGSKIAFQSKDGLWTMNADLSDPKMVVPGKGVYYLRWTLDDSRLVYVASGEKENEFFSIKPDGTDNQLYLPANAPKPLIAPIVWHPDGRVAYTTAHKPHSLKVSDRGRTNASYEKIVIADPAHGNVLSSIPGCREPAFANDGAHMIYLSNESIYVADRYGKNPKRVLCGMDGQNPLDISWHPDSYHILYSRTLPAGREMRSVFMDGQGDTLFFSSPVRFFYPSWSPRGDRVLFAMKQTDDDLWLYSIDHKGENLTKMVGQDDGAPIFELIGEYRITGKMWPRGSETPQEVTGTATFTRPMDGMIVRETSILRPGGRPMGLEISLSRVRNAVGGIEPRGGSQPLHFYDMTWLNEWNGRQVHCSGRWDPIKRTLTFTQQRARVMEGRTHTIYEFLAGGSFRRTVYEVDATAAQRKTMLMELRFTPAA